MNDRIPEASESNHSEFVRNLTASQGLLQSYLCTLLPAEADVMDLVQRTNLALWNGRSKYRPGSNFKAWALSVAYWEARGWMTSRKRKGWLIFDDQLVQRITEHYTAKENDYEDYSSAKLSALRLCMAKLRDSDRLVVINHYQHEKSLAECGVVLGRTKESLKVSLFRIRASLRRCIKSHLALERLSS